MLRCFLLYFFRYLLRPNSLKISEKKKSLAPRNSQNSKVKREQMLFLPLVTFQCIHTSSHNVDRKRKEDIASCSWEHIQKTVARRMQQIHKLDEKEQFHQSTKQWYLTRCKCRDNIRDEDVCSAFVLMANFFTLLQHGRDARMQDLIRRGKMYKKYPRFTKLGNKRKMKEEERTKGKLFLLFYTRQGGSLLKPSRT